MDSCSDNAGFTPLYIWMGPFVPSAAGPAGVTPLESRPPSTSIGGNAGITPLLASRRAEFVRCGPNPRVRGPGDGDPRLDAWPCPRGTPVTREALGCDPNDPSRRVRESARDPGDRCTVRITDPAAPPRAGVGERSRRGNSSSDSSMSIRYDVATAGFIAAEPDVLCGVPVELVVVVIFSEVARDDSLVDMPNSKFGFPRITADNLYVGWCLNYAGVGSSTLDQWTTATQPAPPKSDIVSFSAARSEDDSKSLQIRAMKA